MTRQHQHPDDKTHIYTNMEQRWEAGHLTHRQKCHGFKKRKVRCHISASESHCLVGPIRLKPSLGRRAAKILVMPGLPSRPPYLSVNSTTEPRLQTQTLPHARTERTVRNEPRRPQSGPSGAERSDQNHVAGALV